MSDLLDEANIVTDASASPAGIKFRGAAAPIVFWVLCFLSIAVAIELLWQTGR